MQTSLKNILFLGISSLTLLLTACATNNAQDYNKVRVACSKAEVYNLSLAMGNRRLDIEENPPGAVLKLNSVMTEGGAFECTSIRDRHPAMSYPEETLEKYEIVHNKKKYNITLLINKVADRINKLTVQIGK